MNTITTQIQEEPVLIDQYSKSNTKKENDNDVGLLRSTLTIASSMMGTGILFMSSDIIKYGLLNIIVGILFIIPYSALHNWLFYRGIDRNLNSKSDLNDGLKLPKTHQEIEMMQLETKSSNKFKYLLGKLNKKAGNVLNAISSILNRFRKRLKLKQLDKSQEIETETNELSLSGLVLTTTNNTLGGITKFLTFIGGSLASLFFLSKFSTTLTNVILTLGSIDQKYAIYFNILFSNIGFFSLFAILKSKSEKFFKFAAFYGISMIFVLFLYLIVVTSVNGWSTSFSKFSKIPGMFSISFPGILNSLPLAIFVFYYQFIIPRVFSFLKNRSLVRALMSTTIGHTLVSISYVFIGVLGCAIIGGGLEGNFMEAILNLSNPVVLSLYNSHLWLKYIGLAVSGLFALGFGVSSYFTSYEPYEILNSKKIPYPNLMTFVRFGVLAFFYAILMCMVIVTGFKWEIILKLIGFFGIPTIGYLIPDLIELFNAKRGKKKNVLILISCDIIFLAVLVTTMGYFVFTNNSSENLPIITNFRNGTFLNNTTNLTLTN